MNVVGVENELLWTTPGGSSKMCCPYSGRSLGVIDRF